jgi:hypothetical protein
VLLVAAVDFVADEQLDTRSSIYRLHNDRFLGVGGVRCFVGETLYAWRLREDPEGCNDPKGGVVYGSATGTSVYGRYI